jgi:hypothetical protein
MLARARQICFELVSGLDPRHHEEAATWHGRTGVRTGTKGSTRTYYTL